MIVWLASYPRSGNTLLRALIKHRYGVDTHDIYDEHHVGNNSATGRYIRKLVGGKPVSLHDAEHAPATLFFKTHELPEEDYPALYIVRDGRDALVSYAHFVLDFVNTAPVKEDTNSFNEMLRDVIVNPNFGGWSTHVLAWTQRSTLTAVVRYEDLVNNPVHSLENIMSPLGYCPRLRDSAQIPSFEELHANAPLFFRRGIVGNWKDEMSEPLHELFWENHGDAMHKLGYER